MNNLYSNSHVFMLMAGRKDRGIFHVFNWCVIKRSNLHISALNGKVTSSNRVQAMEALDI
jgi:hypothetical protein